MSESTIPETERRLAGEVANLTGQLDVCDERLTAAVEDRKKLLKRVGQLTGRVLQLESLLREKGIEVPA